MDKKHQYYKKITIEVTADTLPNLDRGFQEALKRTGNFPLEMSVKDNLQNYKVKITGGTNDGR